MAHPDIVDALDDLALIDHHVHGTLRVELDREALEEVMTESDRPRRAGTTNFDSQFGLALRKFCAPLLGLAEFASPEDYVAARQGLGAREVNRRLLSARWSSTRDSPPATSPISPRRPSCRVRRPTRSCASRRWPRT